MASDSDPPILSIGYVVTEPRLYTAFEKFITDKYALENLLFYRDVLAFKRNCENMEFDELKEKSLEIVTLYLKRDSARAVNVSSPMRQHVLDVLKITDSAKSVFDDDFGGVELVDDDDAYSEDEASIGGFGGFGGEIGGGNNFFSTMANLGKEEERELTKEDMYVVFDETFREIQTLIDRNFMDSFQHEIQMRQLFDAMKVSYWPYQGYLTIVMCKRYERMARLELETVQAYIKERARVVTMLKEPIGQVFGYMKTMKQVEKIADEFQSRLPFMGWLCGRLNNVFIIRNTLIGEYVFRTKEIQSQIDSFLGLYDLQQEALPLVDDERFLAMEDKYSKLRAFTIEANKIKTKINSRIDKKPNGIERNKLKELEKKKLKFYFELQSLEDLDRGHLMDAFNGLESLEFTRMEKVMKLMSAMRYSEIKLLSDLELGTQFLRQDVEADIKSLKEAEAFTFRNPNREDRSRTDPVEGIVNFDVSDFKDLHALLKHFESIVMSYAESVVSVSSNVIKTFLSENMKCCAIAERFKFEVEGGLKLEMPPFQTELFNMMTDDGLLQKASENMQGVETMGMEFQSLIDYAKKKMADIVETREQAPASLQEDGEDLQAYKDLYARYIKSCKGIITGQKCRKLREIKEQQAETMKEMNYLADGEALQKQALFLHDLELEMKELTEDLVLPIELRNKLLALKMQIVNKTIKPRLQWLKKCLRAFLTKEVDNIKLLQNIWNGLSRKADIVESMKWSGEKIIARDREKIIEQMVYVLNSNISYQPPQKARSVFQSEAAPLESQNTTQANQEEPVDKNSKKKKGFGLFGRNKKG